MSILTKGVIRSGQIVVQSPINLPDGAEVTISLEEFVEGDPPTSLEERAATLAAMEQMEPLSWTEEERAVWEKERQEQKAWEKARFMEQAEKLRRF